MTTPNDTTVNTSIEMNTDRQLRVDISEADKENFYKSILADKPYEKTMPLFDEQFRIRFRTMTVQENSDVVKQIVHDRAAKKDSDTDAYFITIASYRLAVSLMSVNDEPFTTISRDIYSPVDEHDTYVAGKARIIQQWSTCKLSLFLDAFQKFEAEVIKLSNAVQTANFWKASV